MACPLPKKRAETSSPEYVSTRSPTAILTWRASPPRYSPRTTWPLRSVSVSAAQRAAIASKTVETRRNIGDLPCLVYSNPQYLDACGIILASGFWLVGQDGI